MLDGAHTFTLMKNLHHILGLRDIANTYVSDRADQNKVVNCLLQCIAVWTSGVLLYSPSMERSGRLGLLCSLTTGWYPLAPSCSVESWKKYCGIFNDVSTSCWVVLPVFQTCGANVELFLKVVEGSPWFQSCGVWVGELLSFWLRIFSSILSVRSCMMDVVAFPFRCGNPLFQTRRRWRSLLKM